MQFECHVNVSFFKIKILSDCKFITRIEVSTMNLYSSSIKTMIAQKECCQPNTDIKCP